MQAGCGGSRTAHMLTSFGTSKPSSHYNDRLAVLYAVPERTLFGLDNPSQGHHMVVC